MEWLKDIDPEKVLVWVAPGAFIALFRSFFLKGSFPTIGKDDISTLVLGSVIYRFAVLGMFSPSEIAQLSSHGVFWYSFLGLVPSALGFGLGIFEASDVTGRLVRWCGIAMPTPTPSAWDTLFRRLPPTAFVIVSLKDGTVICGRWAKIGIPSSASSDGTNLDLYIGETGTLNAEGLYVAKSPRRGIYIAASELRTIEVITGA